jgi:hypothetical protein
MKSDEVKQLTEQAVEQLSSALSAGCTEELMSATSRFYRYSLHHLILIALQKVNGDPRRSRCLGQARAPVVPRRRAMQKQAPFNASHEEDFRSRQEEKTWINSLRESAAGGLAEDGCFPGALDFRTECPCNLPRSFGSLAHVNAWAACRSRVPEWP